LKPVPDPGGFTNESFQLHSFIGYCRIQIKSTPFRDRDTPDENFFSSPHFGSRDMVKISSGMAVESHILTTIGVKIIAAVRRWSEN